MGEKKTLSILLKKTLLANDDAILEFLTMEFGKISVFVKKFSRSKKRLEIDFFRLIELEIFQGRNSKSLKKATTLQVFHNFSRDFSANKMGFEWLMLLDDLLPAEEVNAEEFQQILLYLTNFSGEDIAKWNAFFQIKILDQNGFWPRFDELRSDIYFDPLTKRISREKSPEMTFIPNLERQTLEFLRRSSLDEFINKKANLPTNFANILSVIEQIQKLK